MSDADRLWRRHDWWRNLQAASLWVALGAPLVVLAGLSEESGRLIVEVWLTAVFTAGMAHFFRMHAAARIRNINENGK